MSVKVRRMPSGRWEVDIHMLRPDGTRCRERTRVLLSSKSGALRWGQARERLLLSGALTGARRKEVPTVAAFAPRFLEGYVRANRHKPSGRASTESILRVHVVPCLGTRRLDAVTTEEVQRLKQHLARKAPKTVNNILATLNRMLTVAVDWKVIDSLPCRIRHLRVPPRAMAFHEFDEYERLVQAASAIDANTYLIVLLGGEAGLRCGEMMALKTSDVDVIRGCVVVQRSEWKGQVTSPKSGRSRRIPLTRRLRAALRQHRHLRSTRVLSERTGASLTQKMVRTRVQAAERRAGVRPKGVHALRHTFCSHLAMRGAAATAIQTLAGHQDLSTTQRYMHFSAQAIEGAIRLLDPPGAACVVES